MKLVVHHLSQPRDGETENGDAAMVRQEDGVDFFAVIDALGHGPEAAAVAKAAVEHLLTTPLDRGVEGIVDGLHRHLRGSRGAAAMVCSLRDGRIEGCGVGNVEMRSVGTRIPSVLSPGVLGRGQIRLRVFDARLVPGDCILLYSDGILSRFETEAVLRMPAPDACRALLAQQRRPHDDATVLIARTEA